MFNQTGQTVENQFNFGDLDNIYIVTFSGSQHLRDLDYSTSFIVFGASTKLEALHKVIKSEGYEQYRNHAEIYSLADLKFRAGVSNNYTWID